MFFDLLSDGDTKVPQLFVFVFEEAQANKKKSVGESSWPFPMICLDMSLISMMTVI